MKKLQAFVLITTIIFASCKSINQKDSSTDSLDGMSKEEWMAKYTDSFRTKNQDDIILKYENKGLNSPVKAIGKIRKENYGGVKIELILKNNSNKTVDAVRMGYAIYNNFGDNLSDDYGTGFSWAESQETIRPKSSVTVTVTTYKAATKIKHVFVNEVHFTDETKWIGGN